MVDPLHVLEAALTTPPDMHRSKKLFGPELLASRPACARGAFVSAALAAYADTAGDTTPARAGERDNLYVLDELPNALEALRRKVKMACSSRELAALRKDFARRYHPDRAASCQADACMAAMREANALIDAATLRHKR